MANLFSSLRTRLLASYIFILVTTLLVICGVLIVALRANPRSMMVDLSLANYLQQIDTDLDRQKLIYTAPPIPRQQVAFERLANKNKVRVLFINSNKNIVYDTKNKNITAPGDTLQTTPVPYAFDWASNLSFYPMIQGMFHDANNNIDWIYIGQPPDPQNPAMLQILIAAQAPSPLNVSDVIQYYGEGVFVPLIESGIVGLVVAIIMSLIIVRSVARPLQDVARAAESVARGELSERAPVSGPREVRTVAETFNRMTQEVENNQQAQRDFLANVTHDLRTPLTSIQGFSQAIIDGVASNPSAAQRAARIIHDEAGRLNRMVQDLLDLARIEAGRLNMTRNVILIGDILRNVGERLQFKAAERGIDLRLDIPELPNIAGDGDRLVQVFTNVVDNALKHTDSGGTVALSASIANNGVQVQVRDSGEGIPAADLPHIFERFYQVDKSRQRVKREGAGLGLTITKEIVEAHGGRLWVESTEGVGTTFSLWFPMLASDATTISRRRSGRFKFTREEPVPDPVAEGK